MHASQPLARNSIHNKTLPTLTDPLVRLCAVPDWSLLLALGSLPGNHELPE